LNKSVGLIGLGLMGVCLADHLLKAGYAVYAERLKPLLEGK